jgi:hypothetical protein
MFCHNNINQILLIVLLDFNKLAAEMNIDYLEMETHF